MGNSPGWGGDVHERTNSHQTPSMLESYSFLFPFPSISLHFSMTWLNLESLFRGISMLFFSMSGSLPRQGLFY